MKGHCVGFCVVIHDFGVKGRLHFLLLRGVWFAPYQRNALTFSQGGKGGNGRRCTEIGPSEVSALPLSVAGGTKCPLLMAFLSFLSSLFTFLPEGVFLGF